MYIILTDEAIQWDCKWSYRADSSAGINNKISSIVNDCCKLLTFMMQLHVAIFNLHRYTTININRQITYALANQSR